MSPLRVVRGGRAPEPPEPRGEVGVREADRRLLERVVARDPVAHRALYDRYHAGVHAFVRRRARDEGLAEEITADVFFEIWRNAASYRGESPVSTWIFGIANLKVLAARRFHAQPRRAAVRVATDEALERLSQPTDPGDSIQARDELARLLLTLERLPRGQRDVLRLAFLEDRSYTEIAAELGISEANVKTRVNRARTRLRDLTRAASEEPTR